MDILLQSGSQTISWFHCKSIKVHFSQAHIDNLYFDMFPAQMPEINDFQHLIASHVPHDVCSLALCFPAAPRRGEAEAGAAPGSLMAAFSSH